MNVRFGKKFTKQYDKAPHNHALGGKFTGYRSINITGDWRAIYSRPDEKIIYFELLGTHSQLYG